jgi:hypothetical protein
MIRIKLGDQRRSGRTIEVGSLQEQNLRQDPVPTMAEVSKSVSEKVKIQIMYWKSRRTRVREDI